MNQYKKTQTKFENFEQKFQIEISKKAQTIPKQN